MTTIIHVACAALIRDNKNILLAKRPKNKTMTGLWEFPGGKIEAKETPEQCLKRELEEEINVIISPDKLIEINFCSYDYKNFHLILYLYACTDWQNTPTGKEGQELEWFKYKDLHTIKMPEANKVLVQTLQQKLSA